jgi:plasmid stability protein
MNASRSTHLTVRNVPNKVAAAVRAESRRRHQSLNQTVIDLLAAATGVGPEPLASNGLEKLAGRWDDEEFEQFETALADTSRVDPELWK